MIKTNASYLTGPIFHADKICKIAKRLTRGLKFDTIVGIGLSGAIILPLMSRILDKNFFIVRKPNESTHSFQSGEGILGDRWIFVDDLIESGNTYKFVRQRIDLICEQHFTRSKFVGTFLYHGLYESRILKHYTRRNQMGGRGYMSAKFMETWIPYDT